VEIYQVAFTVAVGVLVGVGFVLLWQGTSSGFRSEPPTTSSDRSPSPELLELIEHLKQTQSQLNALEKKYSQPEPLQLDSKFQLLEGQFRSLQLEWSQAHRHLDHLLRRGIRLGVLERTEQAPSPSESPSAEQQQPPQTSDKLSRHQLLQNHRARSRVQ